jgi:hypothetical protein
MTKRITPERIEGLFDKLPRPETVRQELYDEGVMVDAERESQPRPLKSSTITPS